MMHPPQFWNNSKSILRWLLWPLGWMYGKVTECRTHLTIPFKVSVPVICIGNLTLGGAGKTPTSIAIHLILKQLLESKNPKVCFLTRGYRGTEQGPSKINLLTHTAQKVGDEALLLAKRANTYVSKNKILGAQLAVEKGEKIIIMDDGFQNPSLFKNLSFLVIDGQSGFGNEGIFPSGPLRESIDEGFKRAQAVVVIGNISDALKPILKKFKGPIFKAKLESVEGQITQKPVIAFAGIGYPDKFFQTLHDNKFNIVKTVAYADHHPYTQKDIETLKNLAKTFQASLITTEKDYVRLSYDQQENIQEFCVTLIWENQDKIKEFLKEFLKEEGF